MAICGQKPWVNPFGKMSIFRLFELLVFIAQKGIFFVLEYRKRHFPDLYCLKTKLGKMAIFGPKPWVNHFSRNCQFLNFLNFLFLLSRKAFFVLEYRKRHFPGLYCLKKKWEKWSFLDQKHGLTPLEKCQLFDFLNFYFLQPREAFFRSRIS